MKIGVYILDAMVSGVTTFSFDLAHGLRQAGHDATTITGTKSGRETIRWSRTDGGARWWREAPDVTVSYDDLTSVLDSFDRVILCDLDASTLGKDRGFIDGFLRTRTPWCVIAHGNSYDKAHAPDFMYLAENSRSFTGKVLACTAPYSYDEHEIFSGMLCLPIKRPYVPRYLENADVPRERLAGSFGRFSTGKNMHVMAAAWLYGIDADAEITGATINTVATSAPFQTYEELMRRGAVSVTAPDHEHKTAPWAVGNVDDQIDLRYRGAYTDGVDVARRLRVFVNLTSASFSAGTEYTTMEAADAGCLLITPQGMTDPNTALASGKLPRIDIPRGIRHAFMAEALLAEISLAVNAALETPEATRRQSAEWNRQVLRKEHGPKAVAESIVLFI